METDNHPYVLFLRSMFKSNVTDKYSKNLENLGKTISILENELSVKDDVIRDLQTEISFMKKQLREARGSKK